MSITLPYPLPASGSPQAPYVQADLDAIVNDINAGTTAGIVNSGTAGRLALYASSTNQVKDTYVQNSKNITLAIATQASRSANLALTIPNPGNAVTAANFLLSEGAQTINGAQTFSAAIAITATSNHVVLSTSSNTLTISAAAQATSARTWTIPDVSGNGTFAALEGAQTFSGAKTFSSTLTMSGATIAMGSNKITGLADGTASTDAAAFGQIYYGFQAPVQATTTTLTTTTSSTYAATHLAASITPTSSSHRIKITITGTLRINATGTEAHLTIKRGSTDLAGSGGFAVTTMSATGQIEAPVSVTYIDSPATTSSTTYTVYIRNSDNVTTAAFIANSTTAVITLEEIV